MKIPNLEGLIQTFEDKYTINKCRNCRLRIWYHELLWIEDAKEHKFTCPYPHINQYYEAYKS